jgi:hypothetical protein
MQRRVEAASAVSSSANGLHRNIPVNVFRQFHAELLDQPDLSSGCLSASSIGSSFMAHTFGSLIHFPQIKL